MKLIFCLQINTKVFCNLILSVCVCPFRPAQGTKYDKFASLQYLKENVNDEVDFLPVDKHKSFLQ